MMNREEIEATIDQLNTDMLAWTTGNISHTNEFLSINPDSERRTEVLAHIAQADAAEVVRLSAALQAYTAMLIVHLTAKTPVVVKKGQVVTNGTLREWLFPLKISDLRDRVVQINHERGLRYNVNKSGRNELITAITDHCTLQEIIDFIDSVQ